MNTLREQATAPDQYDHPDMQWADEGGLDTPVRKWMRGYLEPLLEELQPESVLDVGCGTAWLSQVVNRYGTSRYVGIDPSRNNVQYAHKFYPGVDVRRGATENFSAETGETFDLVTCLMATEHIDDMSAAFGQWAELLSERGRVLVIAGDKEAFSQERFDYRLRIEPVDDDELVIETIRPNDPASTTDIIRSVGKFAASAEQGGLKMQENIPMPPTEQFIAAAPKYAHYRGKPIFQLMLFKAA